VNDQLTKKTRTRRRLVGTAVAGAIVAGCAFAATPVIDVLRYNALVAEHKQLRTDMEAAADTVTASQDAFYDTSTQVLPLYSEVIEFITTVRPDFLTDAAPLNDLIATKSSLEKTSYMHEKPHKLGVKAVFDKAPAPRLPAPVYPTSVEGLTLAVDHSRAVVTQYTGAAQTFDTKTDALRSDIEAAKRLMEKVLDSASKFGRQQLAEYDKADLGSQAMLKLAIAHLEDTHVTPRDRYIEFESAVVDLRKSHAAAVAEEERIKRELEEAERAAKEAEEAARRAAEEEARRIEEERNKPAPPPTQAPDPTPTPTPTPTPSEEPKEDTSAD